MKHIQLKMRLMALLFAFIIGLGKAFAYDFSAVSPSGHTLYYNINSSTDHTVGLVNPGTGNYVSGNVIVPETVVRNGVTYTVTRLLTSSNFGTFRETSITSVTLPATITKVQGAAFYKCSSLNHITIRAYTPPVIDGVDAWATFVGITSSCILLVPEGTANLYTSAWGSLFSGQIIENGPLRFTAQTDNVTVSMEAVGAAPSVSLEYRTNDNQTWQDFVVGTTQVTINQGEELYVKAKNANNKTASGENDYNRFVVTNSASVSGNIMYLLDPTGEMTEMTSANSWAFGYLFGNCSHITDASLLELPAFKLASRCYWRMFSGCSSLATAPVLPATTLAIYCYAYMFRACSSLTTAPALLATTLASNCYNSMFYGCSSLTAAPALPATTLAIYCYGYMFRACSSLTTAPALPATTLASNCYQSMFYGCTSLTAAPVLPATTLASNCYQQMFQGCSSIKSVTTYAVTWDASYTSDWLSGVSATGIFYNLGDADIPTGNSGIPTGWTATSSPIAFADANVKALCVAHWDTNGDGELSYNEAAAVVDIGTVFKSKTNITSFNELQYFVNLSSIQNQAFYGCTALTQITIPEAVTSIGSRAFWNCPVLQTVHFNAKNCTSMATSSQYSVFNSGTSDNGASPIVTLTIGSNVTRIPDYAFHNSNNMTSAIVIPDATTYIGECAFYGSHSLELTIGEGVTTIGSQAFWNCPVLQTVHFNAKNCTNMKTNVNGTLYSVFSSNGSGGPSALTRIVIGSQVTRIPDYAFKGSEDIYQRLVIPASVTSIGDYAFCDCNSIVQMVIQGNSLQTIGGHAFENCSALASTLNLPNSVTSIGDSAFRGCSNLKGTLNLSNVNSLGSYAFHGCSSITGTLTLCNTLTEIKPYTFYGCSGITGHLVIPNSVTSIGEYAFYGIHCGELTIGEGVTSISGYAFWNCPQLQTVHFNATNCTSMKFGSQVTGYLYSVFNSNSSLYSAQCPIVTLTIGSNVTRIPGYAFHNSNNMTSAIVIPDATTYIEGYAFYGSRSPELTIGKGVTSIGDYAFWNCPQLQTVHFNATNCTSMATGLQYSVFNSETSDNGASPIVTLTIGSNVTRIPDHAFSKGSNMTCHIVIPDATTSIGKTAFFGSHSPELTIGEGVTTIGDKAFWNCPALQTVHFNATNCISMVTNSQYSVFNSETSNSGASPIVTLTIGSNVTRIPDYAFYNSSNMTCHIVIPDATTYIGQYAFYGSHSPELIIGKGVTTIGDKAFWNCPQLQTVHFNAKKCTSMETSYSSSSQCSVFNSGTSYNGASPIVTLTIGSNVTWIPNYAFRNSSNMTCNLIIPDGVTFIGKYAFENCSGITGDLFFPNSILTLGDYAFYQCRGFQGDLVIPNSVTTLGSCAFQDCSGFNGSLIIGNGVQAVNQYAFAGCTGFLGTLIVGRQVNTVGSYAFRNCSGFTSVISENPMPPTAVISSFQGMTYTIPLYVPYGTMSSYQNATGWKLFTNRVEQCVFDAVGMSNENWSNEECWYAFELPGANDVVCINSNCQMDIDANVLHTYVYNLNDVLTIKSGKTLTTPVGLGILQPSQLVMEEGSQIVNNVPGVHGTVQRQIGGYTSDNDGWYTIAAPIYGGMPVSNLTLGNYDLFAYDEPNHYWRNVKNEDNDFSQLNPAQGYLYANQANRTVALTGQFNASNAQISMPVTCIGDPLEGFNLVGNPYTNNISIGDVKINGVAQTAFYRAEGGNLVAYVASDNEPIKPGDGFFVKATENGTLTFGDTRSRGERQQDDNYVRLVLNKDGKVADRAYLRMNQGTAYEKLSMGAAHNQLYFKDNGQSYAIANRETESSMVPLFLENANGTYTIEATQLNAQCEYLHLIDNLTGADIDLLETPTYTFDSKPSNYASRFKLVFSEDQENASTDSESNFAYISNGELVISNEGQATLQVIDVMGRVLVSQTIDGECRFSTESMTKGLYILNLNGMTQKIVVE